MKVLFITSHYDKGAGSAPFVKREFDALKKYGIDIELFSYVGAWNIITYIKTFILLRQKTEQTKYDLLHARFGQCGLLAVLFYRHKTVVTFGGSDLQGSVTIPKWKNWLLVNISKISAKLCTSVIIVSERLSEVIKRVDYNVIPSGVDINLFKPLDYFESREKLSLKKNTKYILFVGNPSNQIKRYDLFIEVINQLRILNKHNHIEILRATNLPTFMIPIYMNSADCLVLTSYNEGSPNVIKEALACELPVVSVDVGDVSKHILKFKPCKISKTHSSIEIANLVNNTILSGNRAVGGYEYIKRNLSLKKMAKSIIEVYNYTILQ